MKFFFSTHKRTFFALIAAFFYSVAVTYATPPLSQYTPAETLDPSCAPGDTNCSVSLYPDQTGQAGNVLTTNGTTVSWTTIPASTNIYNTDGTLSANRVLTLSGNSLDIAGTTTTRFFDNGNVAIGNTTDDGYKLKVQGNTRVNGQLTAVGTGMIGGVTNSDFVPTIGGSPSSFQVNQTGGNYGLSITRSDNGASSAHLTFYRTRGGGVASARGALVNSDAIGALNYFGIASDGNTQFLAASIVTYAWPTASTLFGNVAPPTNTVPSSFQFSTTGTDGARRRRLDILPNGEVILTSTGFLNWSNGYRLQVDGNSSLHGNLLVGTGVGTIINDSAVLEVSSATRGALLPRMTNAQRAAITTPATGLLAYSTDTTEGLYVNTSGGWQRFLTSGDTFSNIYTTDGSLTGARTLTLNANTLDIAGTTTTRFFANGNVGVKSTIDNGFSFQVDNPNNNGAIGFLHGGIYFNGENGHHLNFNTGLNGGTQTTFMSIRNSGNVLVGTTTDSGYKLDVNGAVAVRSNISFPSFGTTVLGVNSSGSYYFNSGGAGTGGQNIAIGNSAVAQGNYAIAINNANAQAGGIGLSYTRADAGEFVAASAITFNGLVPITNVYFGSGKYLQNPDGTFNTGSGTSYTINGSGAYGTDFAGGNITLAGGKGTGTGTPGNIIFSTATALGSGSTLQSLSERARFVGANGNLLIGTTTDSGHKLQVNGTVAFNALTVAGSSQDALCIVNGGTEVQRNNGAQTCTVSSARFKHDIQPLSGDILGTLTKFTPSTFIYNDQTNTRIGLIAEEVATIDPRLVFYEADGTTPRGVRYEDLAVLTLKGLQEITIQVTTLGDLTKENTLRATLTAWLGDVGNGIGKVFAKKVETEELCVKKSNGVSVCVTGDQLEQLLAQPASVQTVVEVPIVDPVVETVEEVTNAEETPTVDVLEQPTTPTSDEVLP